MVPMTPLDRFHARLRATPLLQHFTALVRLLLVIGFVPPAITKILGHRFTTLPLSNPVGFFFEAFYRSGLWYPFVGWAQLVAALLLLSRRTLAIGALLYLAIIVNVMLITIGIGFTGTPVITVLMTLAALWLVAWEYDAWRALLPWSRAVEAPRAPARAAVFGSVVGGALAGGAAFAAAWAIDLARVTQRPGAIGFAILPLAGAAFGALVAWYAPRSA